MPEEKPLLSFTSLQLVGEAEDVLTIVLLEQVHQFCGGLHDGERRRFGGIKYDGNTTIRIEAEKPIVLLHICGYIAAMLLR